MIKGEKEIMKEVEIVLGRILNEGNTVETEESGDGKW